jgi:hypothetical protein
MMHSLLRRLHEEGIELGGYLHDNGDDEHLEFSWTTPPHDVWVTEIEHELLLYVNIREHNGRCWKSHIREVEGNTEEKIASAVALLKAAFTRPAA